MNFGHYNKSLALQVDDSQGARYAAKIVTNLMRSFPTHCTTISSLAVSEMPSTCSHIFEQRTSNALSPGQPQLWLKELSLKTERSKRAHRKVAVQNTVRLKSAPEKSPRRVKRPRTAPLEGRLQRSPTSRVRSEEYLAGKMSLLQGGEHGLALL